MVKNGRLESRIPLNITYYEFMTEPAARVCLDRKRAKADPGKRRWQKLKMACLFCLVQKLYFCSRITHKIYKNVRHRYKGKKNNRG
jgi:hypothetical protein